LAQIEAEGAFVDQSFNLAIGKYFWYCCRSCHHCWREKGKNEKELNREADWRKW